MIILKHHRIVKSLIPIQTAGPHIETGKDAWIVFWKHKNKLFCTNGGSDLGWHGIHKYNQPSIVNGMTSSFPPAGDGQKSLFLSSVVTDTNGQPPYKLPNYENENYVFHVLFLFENQGVFICSLFLSRWHWSSLSRRASICAHAQILSLCTESISRKLAEGLRSTRNESQPSRANPPSSHFLFWVRRRSLDPKKSKA